MYTAFDSNMTQYLHFEIVLRSLENILRTVKSYGFFTLRFPCKEKKIISDLIVNNILNLI